MLTSFRIEQPNSFIFYIWYKKQIEVTQVWLTEYVQNGLVVGYHDATPVFRQVLSATELPRDTQDFGYMLQNIRHVPGTR
jgi:hypothetical protein